MLNAKQMADEIRAYREAGQKEGLRLPCWHARDTERKTRPVRLLWPNPTAPRATELMVQTDRISFNSRIVERIDLTATDADARFARYVEAAPG